MLIAHSTLYRYICAPSEEQISLRLPSLPTFSEAFSSSAVEDCLFLYDDLFLDVVFVVLFFRVEVRVAADTVDFFLLSAAIAASAFLS